MKQRIRHYRMFSLACVTLCALQLLGCQAPTPTLTQEPPVPTTAVVPSPTQQEAALSVVSPTQITPESTVEPTRDLVLSPTPSPVPSRTPTEGPTPLPTFTFTPDMQPEAALQAMEDGDYPKSIALWRGSLEAAEPSERSALELSLARAHIAEGQHHEAITLLAHVITSTVSLGEQADALGLLAGSYEALGEWRAAIDTYVRYLELDDAAIPYVRWHMAKVYEAMDEQVYAAQQLAAIALDGLPAAMQAEILEELATVRWQAEYYEGAMEAYERILEFARQSNYRALVLYKQGETLIEANQRADAAELLNRIPQEYPESYAAYMALGTLDEMRAAELTELERGRILYHAGQYGAAIEALDRYVLINAEGELAEAHYFTGLAYEHLGQFSRAFQEYDAVIRRYPQDAFVADAWMAKARAAADYGGDPSGLYYEFWRNHRDHARAPEALWLAGAALEGEKEWGRAAEFYNLLRTSYPEDPRALEATFREGLAAYALGDMETARGVWIEALRDDLEPREVARLQTWLGLAARADGDASYAQLHWRDAQKASPWSYYGLRARDLEAKVSLKLAPTTVQLSPLADGRLGEPEWSQIATWIEGWHEITETVTIDLSQDILARRGGALWRLGWHEEALTTYRLLRDNIWDDPQELLALARICDEIDLHSLTISCAARLTDLGHEKAEAEPPEPLLRLSYPVTFGHLVSAEAQRYAIDPLLFLALIRQESRFDPRAVSYAGAIGLAQIMPDTGTWIASLVETGFYRRELLYRPYLNVEYGMWFMNWLLDLYDRDWVMALVAYNAGPGNLDRWANGQPVTDHDLFYETLPISQARDYVEYVYRQYRMYESIYRKTG